METIIITGAGGYIGSVLTPAVVEAGYRVVAIDRFFFGREKLPKESANLRVIEDDIRFVSPKMLRGAYAIIDLAALSNDPAGELDPIKTHSINHLGRFRIAGLAKAQGVARYILPSSCSIYGFQDGIVDEKSAVNPLTTYAKANYNLENDVLQLADDRFCVVILRQATVFGQSPRMRYDLAINGMVRGFVQNGKIPILKDGTQWRPFVHVRDTCRAMIQCLGVDPGKVNRQILNVGGDSLNYQIFDLAQRVARAMDVDFCYEWYGVPDHRSYRVSFDKIHRVLGFTPEYDAERGAREAAVALREGEADPDDPRTITVNWYKKLISDGVML
jgi:nucleoside-diphosphate-sugar epimerase